MKTFADFGIPVQAGATGEVDTICPQCSPTRKKKHLRCLSVSTEKGTWHCHHCGWGGGLGSGEKRYEPAWRKPAFRKPSPPVVLPLTEGQEFFKQRGITQAVLQRNHVSEATVYMPQVEDHVRALAFPYYREGELVNVKYRDFEKNFRMEAGAERVLYGLNDIDPRRCVIVEGEIDKLSIEVAGVVSCVSVPDGAPSENTKNYSSKFGFLDADSEKLEGVQEWIIAVDNDGPGKRLEDELARRLGREKCKRVTWPGDCKDANDVLRAYGPELLAELIDHAEAFPIHGVFTVEEFSQRIDELYERGWERGVLTGWAPLDEFYSVRPGELTVVTGIPNSGKSNWLDCLCVNLARDHGWNFAIFSPENQPLEDHMARMCEKWARMPFGEGPRERMDRASLTLAKSWVGNHFSWILPDDDSEWTMDNVLEKSKALVFRKGIRGLVIDPWNELEHALPPGISETIYTGQMLKRVRQFGRRHGVHVWLVAHPQKLYRSKEDGKYPVPTLYDISGSANWRNKADNGVVVYREFENPNNGVDIHVQKVRFRQIGKIGTAELFYDRATQTYSETPRFSDATR